MSLGCWRAYVVTGVSSSRTCHGIVYALNSVKMQYLCRRFDTTELVSLYDKNSARTRKRGVLNVGGETTAYFQAHAYLNNQIQQIRERRRVLDFVVEQNQCSCTFNLCIYDFVA